MKFLVYTVIVKFHAETVGHAAPEAVVCGHQGDIQDFTISPTRGPESIQVIFRDAGGREGYLLDALQHRLLVLWKVETAPVLSHLGGEGRAVIGISIAKSARLMGFMYYALIPGSLFGGFINRRVPDRRVLLAVPVVMSEELSVTLFGLSFAIGPEFVGIAAQISGSAQVGMLIFTALTGLGSLAGVFYPRYRRST